MKTLCVFRTSVNTPAYRIYSKKSDPLIAYHTLNKPIQYLPVIFLMTKNVGPDQKPRSVASDQDLHCLPIASIGKSVQVLMLLIQNRSKRFANDFQKNVFKINYKILPHK